MRGSRNIKRPERGRGIAILIIVLMCAGFAVYMIGGANVGRFLSQQVFSPAAKWLAGDEGLAEVSPAPPVTSKNSGSEAAPDASAATDASATPVPTAAASGTQTNVLRLQKYAIYALDAGAYKTMQEAQVKAAEQKKKGGAGFITKNGEEYHVLLAAYPKESDAQNVAARIREQNIETSITATECDELDFKITATPAAMEKAVYITENITKWIESLYDAAISLDSSEWTFEETIKSVSSIKTNIEIYKKEVDDWASTTDNNIISNLTDFLTQLFDTYRTVAVQAADIELSSELKYAYIDVSRAYADMLARLRER